MAADKDTATESSGDFLARIGTDGAKWAAEFCKRFPAVPEDDALGWFCNAIEAGRAAGLAQGEKSHAG